MRAKSSNEKHKKIILNKNKIFYTSFLILAFALFFLLGTWSEKYDYNKISQSHNIICNKIINEFKK